MRTRRRVSGKWATPAGERRDVPGFDHRSAVAIAPGSILRFALSFGSLESREANVKERHKRVCLCSLRSSCIPVDSNVRAACSRRSVGGMCKRQRCICRWREVTKNRPGSNTRLPDTPPPPPENSIAPLPGHEQCGRPVGHLKQLRESWSACACEQCLSITAWGRVDVLP